MNSKYTKLFFDVAKRIAEESKCRSRHVGAVIVKDERIISEGWNSPPKKCHERACVRCNEETPSGKNLELALCTHAEVNAISSAAYLGYSLNGAHIYCTVFPCAECAKIISASGITKIFYLVKYPAPITEYICKQAGIELTHVDLS